MGQHDPGAADSDALCRGGDRRNDDLGCGADDGRVVMMLRHPEALVSQRLAMLGQGNGVADRQILRATRDGNRLIEDGQTHISLNLREGDVDVSPSITAGLTTSVQGRRD